MPDTLDQAPDCVFTRLEGGELKLSDFAGRPLVLIFLRHLA